MCIELRFGPFCGAIAAVGFPSVRVLCRSRQRLLHRPRARRWHPGSRLISTTPVFGTQRVPTPTRPGTTLLLRARKRIGGCCRRTSGEMVPGKSNRTFRVPGAGCGANSFEITGLRSPVATGAKSPETQLAGRNRASATSNISLSVSSSISTACWDGREDPSLHR